MKNRGFLIFLIMLSLMGDMNAQESDYEKDFLNRYEFFITENERKAFLKLDTDEDKDVFIEEFWLRRDSDPNTEINEYKQEIDKRIGQIQRRLRVMSQGEIVFQFTPNYGLKSDPARVYLLHGTPYYARKISGRTFVDLMLWLYVDESGNEKYRFLFYQRHGIGNFLVFRNHDPQLAWALSEISIHPAMRNNFMTNDLFRIYEELRQLFAYEFIRALASFSDVSNVNLDKALGPPPIAAELAKDSGFKVKGVPKLSKDIKITRSSYGSSIPMSVHKLANGLHLVIPRNGIDWIERNGKQNSDLILYITVQNINSRDVRYYTRVLSYTVPLDSINNSLIEIRVHELDELGPGKYIVYMTLKHRHTFKYSALVETFVK